MHRSHFPRHSARWLRRARFQSSDAAFSLIEVTLAIGIIAFAFVALFGLLPTGLQTFRGSIDATNDTTMLQDMNTMAQVTAWEHIEKLDQSRGGDIFYFDEEGRRTDTDNNPSTKKEIRQRRLYQVKLLVEKLYEPGDTAKQNPLVDSRRVVVIIGDFKRGKKSDDDFKAVTKSDDLLQVNRALDVRARTFVISRMEAAKGK